MPRGLITPVELAAVAAHEREKCLAIGYVPREDVEDGIFTEADLADMGWVRDCDTYAWTPSPPPMPARWFTPEFDAAWRAAFVDPDVMPPAPTANPLPVRAMRRQHQPGVPFGLFGE